ncbi:MAG: hypothetical protein COA78_32810 [Blastopirellula sp.]|nr:MAG: hypothetical protein COA78_32810 [Blastopirellula sp.]
MANYKRKRARTRGVKSCGPSRERMAKLEKHGVPYRWWQATPSWHNIIYNNRPKRRLNKALARKVVGGADQDDIAWPLGNHKPHAYYW